MNYPSSEQLAEMTNQLTQARIDLWLQASFGHRNWWFLVGILILPWIIMHRVVDKKQLRDILLMALIVMVFSITLDELGLVLSFWYYPIQLIPILPRLTSVDYAVMPVTYALTYQYCPTWKSFFWGMVGVAAICAFIIEPILVSMGIYVLVKWQHIYSFPIYIFLGVLSRWIVCKIIEINGIHQ